MGRLPARTRHRPPQVPSRCHPHFARKHQTSAVTPLLAIAACGLFDPRLSHEPIRRRDFHARYIKAYVIDVDFHTQTVVCQPAFEQLKDERFNLFYDKMVITPGCRSNTFGIPSVEENAIFVKNVANANTMRSRLNDLLEMASLPRVSEVASHL